LSLGPGPIGDHQRQRARGDSDDVGERDALGSRKEQDGVGWLHGDGRSSFAGRNDDVAIGKNEGRQAASGGRFVGFVSVNDQEQSMATLDSLSLCAQTQRPVQATPVAPALRVGSA
jgi:hypothetical protein